MLDCASVRLIDGEREDECHPHFDEVVYVLHRHELSRSNIREQLTLFWAENRKSTSRLKTSRHEWVQVGLMRLVGIQRLAMLEVADDLALGSRDQTGQR